MYLQELSEQFPSKIAAIIADTGETATFGELYEKTAKLAHYIIKNTKKGDIIANLQKNTIGNFISMWACVELPIRLVPINWHLTATEASHIMNDSGALGLISSPELSKLANDIVGDRHVLISDDHAFDKFVSTELELTVDIEVEDYGALIYYSSGTTGRPKGVMRDLLKFRIDSEYNYHSMARQNFNITQDSVLYAPGPFYHAAASSICIATQTAGGTAITTGKFDAESTLAYIEKYKITHLMLVPTHMVRLLKLPKEIKDKYDISSLRSVIHGAAPCPTEVKEQLIEWMGPIFTEYYSNSEMVGYTTISSEEWLSHRGSVGKPLSGKAYVVNKDGVELSVGEIGYIVFDHVVTKFKYSNEGGSLLKFGDKVGVGDIGYIDEEQYVYLTDRANDLIISGGVNIYPQETENVLILHPAVKDVAVIGVPDDDLGQTVKAIVELSDTISATEELKTELIDYTKQKLSSFKCPKTIDFIDVMPRSAIGKLLKNDIRKNYAK